jgi:hypothetical protein
MGYSLPRVAVSDITLTASSRASVTIHASTTDVHAYLPIGVERGMICRAALSPIRHDMAVRWIRRGARSSDDVGSPIPLGMSQLEAARQVVAALLADPPDTSAEIDGVEAVELRSGHPPSTTTHGVAMQWRQGSHEYGLLMPIERLAHQAGGLDSVPFYLGLAVDEPHNRSPQGTRTWFTDLPSGPYESPTSSEGRAP